MKTDSVTLDENTVDEKTKSSFHFKEHDVLHQLKHFLPAQAPLKDFIHHNTLHAFQHETFYKALQKASDIFGFRVFLPAEEYREMYNNKRIRKDILETVLKTRKGDANFENWFNKLLNKPVNNDKTPRIGQLRAYWKNVYHIDLDTETHPLLFRVIGSFLDQGISMWHFPVWKHGFLYSIRALEKNSFSSFFKTKRAKELLFSEHLTIAKLLKIIVGNERLFETYLYDQQFTHPGWSGLVSSIEDQPQTLLDERRIKLKEVIIFELLLEIDALDYHFKSNWKPLGEYVKTPPEDLFAPLADSEDHEVLTMWQEAFEWSYYDQVLAGIKLENKNKKIIENKSFQAMFCIDDRECSLRRYLESIDPNCETFGTPGFFGVEFYYKPEHGKFYTKLCPAPVNPKYLIKEKGTKGKVHQKDAHFSKHSHSLFRGWLISSTLGFWSAVKLSANIFRPSMGPATATSFKHMDEFSALTIVHSGKHENELQIGFTFDEMATRVENLLRSIGLIENFAQIIYVLGHGSSSVNTPHYAAYDCGACSGRPGSVNARVFCSMANNPKVRELLAQKGIVIPATTQFLGGLHDTTRDEVAFYDEASLLLTHNYETHKDNRKTFDKALDLNSKERSRRFVSINTKSSAAKIHEQVKVRSVSLFEPRPELNHATNALCIVGRRELSKSLFLDRRSFLNSFDYKVDPEGKYLLNILRAAAPVCGGINLEYFFSRVDNTKLGAGTKLPHNVMGLVGVANGADGDLRPGLPSQMIEVHDPVRLLMIVEHFPDIVLRTIQQDKNTYEWFQNDWVHLIAIDPETQLLYQFKNDGFIPYDPLQSTVETIADLTPIVESETENCPVYLIS
jgi:uncharacterized protein